MISLNKHSIHASIADRYATISYIFEFENLREHNGSDELQFEVTIDPEAFISGFSANIDGELFEGQTKEKKEAKQEYTTAKEKNENAILISQPYADIPNIFGIKTNIDSKSKILLTIKIEEYLKKQFNFNQVNIEIVQEFNKYNITKNYKFILYELNITDTRGIFDIKLPSNDDIVIDKNTMNKNNTFCTINGKIISEMNEFILKYKINGEENESNILYDKNSKTFVHIINNISAADSNNNMIPRRVVFIVDKSASMQGEKWAKTIIATSTGIKQLRINYDRYCLLFFDDKIELSSNIGMILADKTNILQSIAYVEKQSVGNSTNINDALLKGIELIKNDINLLKNAKESNFFINQGETNTNNIISNVMKVNKLSGYDGGDKISIFSFGVGSDKNDGSWAKDLNHSFLKLLSLNNDGIYKRIKESKCDKQLSSYFNILSNPILSNISVHYSDNINCNNFTKTSFNTLYGGNDIIICGKLENNKILTMTANISATTGTNNKAIKIDKKIKINLNESEEDEKMDNNIERIWAYLKLKQFAETRLLNNDMIEYDEDDDKIALSLAMKYKFVTPWTSMIVVKHKKMKQQRQELNTMISDSKQEEKEKEADVFDENIISHKMDLYSRTAATLGVVNYNSLSTYIDVDYNDDMDDCGGLDDYDEILTLKSGGVSFEISKQFAENSKFVTTILEGDADATSIEIRQVPPEVLELVIYYLNNMSDTWDVNKWMNTFDLEIIIKIKDAADYMDIKDLYLLCKKYIDDKEKQMNVLIDTKYLTITKQKYFKTESIKTINEILCVFQQDNIQYDALLKNCTFTNMIYLINKILEANILILNQNQKKSICAYFVENKINAKLFISLTEKGEFVKNISIYMKKSDINHQQQVSNKSLVMLQSAILQIISK